MKNLRGNKGFFKNVLVSTRKATVTLEKEGRRSHWLEIMQKRTATCHQKKKKKLLNISYMIGILKKCGNPCHTGLTYVY